MILETSTSDQSEIIKTGFTHMPEAQKWTDYTKVFKTLIIIRQLRTVIPERRETKRALWPFSFLPREKCPATAQGMGTQAGPGKCSELGARADRRPNQLASAEQHTREDRVTEMKLWSSTESYLFILSRVLVGTCVRKLPGAKEIKCQVIVPVLMQSWE